MLACIGMRKGMDTITEMPNHADGTAWLISPREGIPAHNIETHELGHIYRRGELNTLLNEHFQNLYTESQDGPYDETYLIPEVGDVQATTDNQLAEDSTARMNTGLLRILNIASMDLLSYAAMMRQDVVGDMSSDAAQADLAALGLTKKGITSARAQTAKAAHHDGILTMGAAHTEALYQGTGDGGLTYLQLLGRGEDPEDFIPVEREAVIKRVCARSPVNTHILALCAERAAEKEKTLVMVATPWEQQ